MGFWSGLGNGIANAAGKLNPLSWGDESDSQKLQRGQLVGQGDAAAGFADTAQQGYGQLGGEASAQRDYLRSLASGQNSVSAEQLRQGLQQNLAAQQSMAAGAGPQNAAMAARTAAIQSAHLGSGMAGQQALAGLQERQGAQQALANMILQQRQQDLQASLGSRQTAAGAYGGYKPEGSFMDKWSGPLSAGIGALVKSDRRAKANIQDGDDAANKALNGLRSYTFSYKSERDGKGRQFGTMTDELKSAGLGHAVIDTPDGEVVHGAKLATSAVGLVSALGRRVAKLEGSRK
jgi:endosialidase-like protein